MAADPLPSLLTIDDLASRLGVTVRHVRRLIAERRIPYLKVGWLIRFDANEIAPGSTRPAAPTSDLPECASDLGQPARGRGHPWVRN